MINRISLNSLFLESLLRQNWGLDLSDTSFVPERTLIEARRRVPLFKPDGFHESYDSLFEDFSENPPVCSLKIEPEDLQYAMFDLFHIAGMHYLRAKTEGMNDFDRSFPRGCCMATAEHIVLAGYMQGFPNGMIARNSGGELLQNVAIFPIIVGKEEGYILVDGVREAIDSQTNPIAVKILIPGENIYSIGSIDFTPNSAITRDNIHKSLQEVGSVDPKYQQPLNEILKIAFSNTIHYTPVP